MDEKFQNLKKITGTVLKRATKPFFIIVAIVVIVLMLIAGILYIVTLDDAVYNDKDKKNVPYAVEQYTSSVSIDANGNISTEKTAKELWDELIKNGSKIKDYLDGPEDLLKMMNAEMVTNYLDTRPDPSKKINWKKINKDVNSKTVQGIIKLKRAFDNGKTSLITYIDPETFQSYIDEYNNTGSEEAKKKALSHFTLENGYVNSNSTNAGIVYGTGEFTKYTDLTEQQIQELANLCKQEQGSLEGAAAEASLMANRFELYGNRFGTGAQGLYNYVRNSRWWADAGYYMSNGSAGEEYKEVVKAVLVNGKRTVPGYIDEHDCFSDLSSVTNNGTPVTRISERSQYVQHVTKIDNNYESSYTFYSFPTSTSDPFGYIHQENRMRIGDFYYDFTTGQPVNQKGAAGNGNTAGTVNSLDKMLFIGDSITEGLASVHTSSNYLTNENINLLKNTIYRAKSSVQARYWLDHFGDLPSASEVNSVCVLLGVNDPNSQGNMKKLIDMLADKYVGKNIYIQKVFPVGRSYSYVYSASEMNSRINKYNSDIEQHCSHKQNVHFIDTTQGFVDNDGYLQKNKASDGVHLTDYNLWVKNIAAKVTGTNTISGDLLKWPTDGNRISSPFGLRKQPTAGASTNHGGIDIAVSTGTNVYATEAGTVVTATYAEDAGNYVKIDHGNGYITKYLHNSVLKVSAGEQVQKGQVIALSGSTGRGTGPHLHFQIEYQGERIDPLTFGYDNGMGNGVGGFGSNVGSLSTNSTIYAKVATWNKITDTLESNDPSVESYSTTTFNMTATKIDYQQLVSGYQLPFDYLWTLLVIGQEKNFIFDLADLVYDSEIEITVHDNLTKNTNVSVDTYTKKTKTVTSDVKVKVSYTDVTSAPQGDTIGPPPRLTTTTGSATETGGPFEKESEVSYQTTHTVVTTTNTLDTRVTKANVWIVDYSQEFTYQTPEATVTNSSIPYDDEEYSDTPDKSDSNDTAGLGEGFRSSVQSQYASQHSGAVATIESLKSEHYYKTVNRNTKITNTTESKKYVSSPAKIVEKTDKQSEEPNFVTLYRKHRKFGNNIESASEWLFEALIKGKNTEDMVELTKYLLYKANGHDYGVTEYDFSVYNPANFVTMPGFYGNSVEEKVWFALRDAGFTEYAVAGAMGNISAESEFEVDGVEGGYNEYNGGIGICQWTNNNRGTTGRNKQLRDYAKSKGKDWKDIDTQIEFLITELTPGASGPAQGYANYQLLSYKGYNGDKWRNATSPEDAAIAFCWSFERPGTPRMDVRTRKAREYYNMFHGKTKPSLGNIDFGNIDSNVQSVLQDVMSRWPANMEEGRKIMILKAASLVNKGCKYSMGSKQPGSANPQYLDCSGYVAWAFTQTGHTDIPIWAYTATFLDHRKPFIEINKGDLIPGDVGLNNRSTSGGGSNHIAIYIGKNSNGKNVWLHCTSSGIDGPQVRIGDGYSSVFKRYKNW